MGAPSDWSYRVRAVNHATDSANRIHADDVAAAYGFRGGLVPGVDVFAYLTVPPARTWGLDWLMHGTLSARFVAPVYDGDEVLVDGVGDDDTVDLTLTTDTGTTCATATARRRPQRPVPAPDVADWPEPDPAGAGRPASPATLAPGTALVPIEVGFHATRAEEYLAEIDERLPMYREEGLAHPGWLLRFANYVLAQHVVLGPWIHVSSDVSNLGVVHDGDRVTIRAVVRDEYERKGHRFVELDVLVTADGRPVQRVTHLAIHTPRPPGGPEV